MGNWGNWCCAGGCWTWEDLFNRVSIGSDWNDVSGIWSIVANELNESGTAGAVLLMASPAVPTPMRHLVRIYVDEPNLAVGAKPRVIVNSNATGTTYHYAEWEKTGSNVGTLRLFAPGGALLAEATGRAFGSFKHFTVCFDNEIFSASLSDAPSPDAGGWLYVCSESATEDYAGIGNGAAYAITVDNFDIEEKREKPWPALPCLACICTCKGTCLPHTLLATITLSNPSGGCNYAGLHGQTFNLVQAQMAEYWSASPTICGLAFSYDFGCTERIANVHGYPAGGTPGDFILWTASRGSEDCPGLGQPLYEYSKVCDPPSIVFGPYTIEEEHPGDLCACCEGQVESNLLWITVTLPP